MAANTRTEQATRTSGAALPAAEPAVVRAAQPPSRSCAAPALAHEDDAALVARCLRGEAAGWSALVQRYQRLVLAIVRRSGLDEHTGADVFQTVFARLVQHLPRIGDPSRLQAWIVTTTKREAILQSQRGRRGVSITRDADDGDDGQEWDFADETPNAEQALDELQQLQRVRAALDRLEPRQRELMLLLFSDDEPRPSYEEIAARLGIPVGSIGPTRARCLDKLRRLL